MIVGLTGGMGCGKTTAARLFARHGFLLLDSDALVRDEILPAPDVRAELAARFGPGVLAAGGGGVDRAALAKVVFADDAALADLEAIVHPRLYARWRQHLGAQPAADWLVEVPLLFEKGLEIWFDFIVCVGAASATQASRLEQRGIPTALAARRIAKQLSLAEKAARSDFVLWNDGSEDFLARQVAHLADQLRKPALV